MSQKTTSVPPRRPEKRTKKAGKVSQAVSRSKLKKPIKVTLLVLLKLLTYLLDLFFTIVLVACVTGVVVGCAFLLYIRSNIETTYDGLDNLRFDSSLNTTLCYLDADGREVELTEDTLHGSENRLWANYSEIPKNLINAVIAIEDQRFYEHNGVDLKRTGGAILNFFSPSGSSYGGSTITQQLIKNVSQEDEATIQRKVQEIFRAFSVEKQFSKQQILEMYLNVIYLSQNSNGVKAAALAYFNKDISELTLVECAALAAIPKYPTYYDPIRNPDNNLQRRNLILKQMLEQEKISQEEFDGAYNVPLYINIGDATESTGETIHSYYIDAVIEDVIAALMKKYQIDRTTASRNLYSGGLRITINMDPDVQKLLEDVYTDDNCFPETTGIDPQSAMVIMQPTTGKVLALIGGRGEKATSRGFNRATMALRQCGSAIKPLSIYALALERGLITYGSAVDDIPTIYNEKTGYWPGNTPAGYRGRIPVTLAVQKSLNTVPVSLGMELGVQNCFDFLTNSLGFTTLVDSKEVAGAVYSDVAISPLALGSFTDGVTVREVTQAYTMFANEGSVSTARTFSMVRDSDGEIIIDNSGYDNQTQAISAENAYIMTKMLETVVSSSNGTAYSVFNLYRKFDHEVEVCGKTGSTNDDRDRYFVGYTPDLCAAVWFGYDNNKSLSKMTYNPATRLWVEVMNRVYAMYGEKGKSYIKKFSAPYDIVEMSYCTICGKRATAACKLDIETYLGGASTVATGYFSTENAPKSDCDCHIVLDYDPYTNAICLPGCYCIKTVKVAFRKLNTVRLLKSNLALSDAKYIYYDPSILGSGFQYTLSSQHPFYYWYYTNGAGRGYYAGYASGTVYNRICSAHYGTAPKPEPETSDTSSENTSADETSSEEVSVTPEESSQQPPAPEESSHQPPQDESVPEEDAA